jgi:hypothetical protein
MSELQKLNDDQNSSINNNRKTNNMLVSVVY